MFSAFDSSCFFYFLSFFFGVSLFLLSSSMILTVPCKLSLQTCSWIKTGSDCLQSYSWVKSLNLTIYSSLTVDSFSCFSVNLLTPVIFLIISWLCYYWVFSFSGILSNLSRSSSSASMCSICLISYLRDLTQVLRSSTEMIYLSQRVEHPTKTFDSFASTITLQI